MDVSSWQNNDDVFQFTEVRRANIPPPERPLLKKPVFRTDGMPSKKRELIELGPSTPTSCFGCCYIGEQESGAVPIESLQKLLNVIKKTISKTDPIELAQYVAEKYKEIQNDVNDSLRPGQKALPDWSAATILEHLQYHNCDPELQDYFTLRELREAKRIAFSAMAQKSVEDETVIIDEKQAKIYLELVKTIEMISKTDPSKKLYYSGGSHFDMKAAAEGPISYSGKNLVSYLRK